jgi:lysine 2,3-aminomutase
MRAIQYTKTMIDTKEQLMERLTLTADEEAFDYTDTATLPLKIPHHFMELIDADDPTDPLRRQVVPSVRESEREEMASLDPLAEVAHSNGGRLIHRYQSRAAFLTTDVCAIHCRHCFRRRFTSTAQGVASQEEIDAAARYVETHRQITELLFTGGDVLTIADKALEAMIRAFRERRPDLVIRLCTRVPAALPSRITDDLIAMIKRFDTAPFFVMVQFNHPRELTSEAIGAVARFIDNGIPAMNQTVLLRGVNDDVDVLQQLCNMLVFNRIKPYYLFQGDLVEGTAHLRVPIKRGLELEAELRKRLSGLAMPTYAVDLPQGGGKVPLTTNHLIKEVRQGVWEFRDFDGERRYYCDPPTDQSSSTPH